MLYAVVLVASMLVTVALGARYWSWLGRSGPQRPRVGAGRRSLVATKVGECRSAQIASVTIMDDELL